jgi:hypothetical protein
MADFLTELEKAIADRLKQLSPEERKIQSKVNLDRMGKQQLNIAAENNTGLKTTSNTGLKTTSNTGLKTVRNIAPETGGMRTVTGRARTVGDDVLKLTGKAPKGTLLKGVGKLAVPLAAAEQAYQTLKLIFSEDARDEAAKDYEDSANEGALMRTAKGALGGVTSIYAAGKNIGDTMGAYTRAREGDTAFQNKQKELIARGILDKDGKPIRREEAAPATSTPASPVPTSATPEAESTGYAKLESAMYPEGVEIGTRPPETVKLESNMFPEGVEVAKGRDLLRGNPVTSTVTAESPKAAPEISEDRMSALFRKTMGTAFDPKSKMDIGKMNQLREFVGSNPDLLNKSDTKIALDYYRTLK